MKTTIFEKIENSKSVDFGDILSKSFELYKKVFQEGLMHTLVSLIVVIPFILVIYIPLLPMYIDMIQYGGDPYYYGNEPFFLESPVMMIGYLLLIFALSILMQVVTMSIYGHFFLALKRADLGTNEDIGGYFDLLKNHFGTILMLTLATLGIALLAALLCYLPILYVMVPLQLILPIFVFNQDLTTGDVIKAAFKLGNKYWGILFGLIIVGGILASLGMLACYIGLVLTAFFTYIVIYYFYKDSIGFDEPTEDISV
ncbi:MAG: hypothetical protein AAF466_04740 [Bacteroidota bacterium]